MPQHPASAVFAKRLKQARALRDVSQRQLGDMLGLGKAVGSTRINRYEQQVSLCDMETAAKIAIASQVPLPFLFAGNDAMADTILAFAQLPKAEQAKVAEELTKRAAKQGMKERKQQ